MSPFLHMSVPKGVKDISSVTLEPGVPMFRSWITLFGVLPIDYSDLTLPMLNSGVWFVEPKLIGVLVVCWNKAKYTCAPTKDKLPASSAIQSLIWLSYT